MDRLLQILLDDLYPARDVPISPPRAEKPSHLAMARACRWPCALPLMQPNSASCSIPSSNSAKPTWTARWWSRRARSPTSSRSCSDKMTASRRLGRGRNGCCAIAARRLAQFNPPSSEPRRNVAHHYDLDGRLYSLFLDADRQYSCAYFETPDTSLDDAQLAKKRHLAAKLILDRKRRVLDIGCGWGGLGPVPRRTAAVPTSPASRFRRSNMRVAQRARGRERACRAAPDFLLQDYRDLTEHV